MDITDNYDLDRLKDLGYTEDFVERMKNDPCWKGYAMVGKKKKGGKTVPNCVPVKKSEHKEGDVAMAAMTPNYLPKEPGTGPEKDPGNSKLAMRAAPNYSETEDFHDPIHSMEPNAGMAINQLRVMREKIDIMLGILYPDDNLEPWMATKLTMSAQNLASVADYMRFGAEFSEHKEMHQSVSEKRKKIKELQNQGHPASILIKQVRDHS